MKKQRFYCKKCGIVEMDSTFSDGDEGTTIVPVFALSKKGFIKHMAEYVGVDKEDLSVNIRYEKLYHAEHGDTDFDEHYVGEFWCWSDTD